MKMPEQCLHHWAFKTIDNAYIIYCKKCEKVLDSEEVVALLNISEQLAQKAYRDYDCRRCLQHLLRDIALNGKASELKTFSELVRDLASAHKEND